MIRVRRAWLAAVLLAATAVAAAPVAVDTATKLPLAAQVEVLADPGAAMDIEAVRRARQEGRFAPLAQAHPSLGYRAGATWAHFSLANPTAQRQERWLEVRGAYQESCTLHVDTGTGGIAIMASGAVVPVAERPLPAHQLLFPVVLEPGQTADLYLRFRTRTATVIDPVLWQPAVYAETESGHLAFKYLAGGTTSVVLVFGILAWRLRRQVAMLGAGAGDLLLVLTSLVIDGLVAEWLPAGDALWPSRLAGAAICLGLACHALFARRFLSAPERMPALGRALAGLAALLGLSAAAALAATNPRPINGFAMPLAFCLFSLLVAVAAWRGLPNARRYLAAWGLLWGVVMLRAFQQQGALRDLPLPADLPYAGIVASALLLAYAMHRDIESLQENADTAMDRLLASQIGEQERLAAAVDARTRELREAISAAETGNRAMSAFLSTMSHEARTSLHTILGYARLLRAGAAGESDTRLGIIENSGRQLLRLINDIIDFGRGQAGAVTLHPEPMSLAALADHLDGSSRLLAAERENRFAIDLATDLPAAVEGDEQRLAQVLQNLITNACKFTAGGDIRLSIYRQTAPEMVDGNTWHTIGFRVEDTGSGIPPQDQERVFDPFFRVGDAQRQPGVGLGLAIARQIVRAMGSDIALASTPGQGSRFSFAVRLKQAPEHELLPALPVQAPIAGLQGRRRTFLVADDIAVNRIFLRELLGSWGIGVMEARNGAEALAICLSGATLPDALLVDQFMPEMDGWSLLRAIRQTPRLQELPIFLISAAQPHRPEDFPPELAFDGMLMKPLDQTALARMLEECLGIAWIRKEGPEATADAGALVLPGPAKIAEMIDMLALGQVLAIEEWADALVQDQPELRTFAREVKRLCAAVDLPRLWKLASLAAENSKTHDETVG